MRDFDVLYDSKVSGVFPDTQAIDASTETAFDGTPSLALNINDLTMGPLEALFTLLGITPDGQPEVKDDSQILDAWRQMAQYKGFEIITGSGVLTLGNFSKVFIIDTSLGGLSNTLPDGVFDGQEVEIICDGTGISAIIGSGSLIAGKRSGIWDAADTTGTKISDGLSLKARWNSSLSKWQVVNEATADYVVGTEQIEQWAQGKMKNINPQSVSGNISSSIGNIFRSDGGNWQYTYSVPFASIPKQLGEVIATGQWYGSSSTVKSSTVFYAFLLAGSAVGAFTTNCTSDAEGDY